MIWGEGGGGKIENEFIFSSWSPLQFFFFGKAFLIFFPGGSPYKKNFPGEGPRNFFLLDFLCPLPGSLMVEHKEIQPATMRGEKGKMYEGEVQGRGKGKLHSYPFAPRASTLRYGEVTLLLPGHSPSVNCVSQATDFLKAHILRCPIYDINSHRCRVMKHQNIW